MTGRSILAAPSALAARVQRRRGGAPQRPEPSPAVVEAVTRRMDGLTAAVAGDTPSPAAGSGLDRLAAAGDGPDQPWWSRLAEVVDLGSDAGVWLAISALSGTFPTNEEVTATRRAVQLDGAQAIAVTVEDLIDHDLLDVPVQIVTDTVVVDVNHTVATDLATGIQRVARESVRRWLVTHACLPVAWTTGFGALRTLTSTELARIEGAAANTEGDGQPERPQSIVVPWGARVVVPELAAEHGRSHRLQALARFSPSPTAVIGFDCVPLTSAETTAPGFPAVFFGNLAAVRYFDTVVTISEAAAVEYRGWRTMLGAVGITGPQISTVLLPAEAGTVTDAAVEAARGRLLVDDLPMVLVVGSHEPRKNHRAVLQAAELCWRAGARFSLTFVGGNSWASEAFDADLATLQQAGRPVGTISRISDDLLWSAYRLARFTVFPSLNEGFGLPVAESLAAGTPVITSDHGSMLEIAADGGAVVVPARDVDAIAAAMSRLLTDDVLLAELREAATRRPPRTWDDYAAEVWTALVEG